MSSSIVKTCLAISLVTAVFQSVVPAFAQSKTESTVAEIALLQGENRQQKLLEGARKEGELSYYSASPREDVEPIIEAFTKKYGIKVKLWRSSTENVLQRLTAEARGGRFEVDIVGNNTPELEALRREKMLQQVRSPYHAELMPQAVPRHREWAVHSIIVLVHGYNTDKVKKEELPKTYQDLLDPRWKGRLGIEAEDHAWFATLLQTLGPEKGVKLFKDIVDTNGISVRKGHTLLANLVASGEVPLGLTLYNSAPEQLKQKGAPIELFVMAPAIAQSAAIALLNKAPHPHAAMLFYDFVLNEGQELLAKRHRVPTTNKIDVPLKKTQLIFIDPVLSLDMNEKWVKAYEDAVTKKTK